MTGIPSIKWAKRLGRTLPALAFALTALAAIPQAVAQNDVQALSDKVDRLQQEISDLERQVYSGQGSASGAGAVATDTGAGGTAASQEVRIQQLEQQMRDLTGQVEKFGYNLQQLSARMDKMSQDIDFRLTQLEHNQPAAGAAATAPAVGGAASAAQPATGTAAATAATTGGDQGNQPLKQSSLAPQTLGTLTQSQVQAATAQQPAASGQTAPATTSAATSASAAAYQLPGNTVEEQYQYAFGLLQQANYDEAEKALRAFVTQHPTDFLAGNAQYWLGETYYVRGRYEDAAVTFAEGYQKFPDNSKAPDDLLKLGMSLGQIGKKPEACVAFAELGKKFPNAPDNVQARVKDEKHRYGCR
jgi:tol-pal system protein YbgF